MTSPPYSENAIRALLRRERAKGNELLRNEDDIKVLYAKQREELENRRALLKQVRNSKAESSEDRAREIYRDFDIKLKEIHERIEATSELVISRELSNIDRLLRETEDPTAISQYNWGIKKGALIKGRQTYRLPEEVGKILLMKQVESQVKSSSRPSEKNRNLICEALRDAVNKPFAFGVLRLDIEKCFDSIDHELLISRLEGEKMLSALTLTLLRSFLKEFATMNGTSKGLPQGIAVSSVLADCYLSKLDEKWRIDPRVAFYARYVDDFVLVLHEGRHLEQVNNDFTSDLCKMKLMVNQEKRYSISADQVGLFSQGDDHFEFLGYKFSKEQPKSKGRAKYSTVKISLSEKRMKRIETKVNLAFSAWAKSKQSCHTSQACRSADHLLFQRIKFLTNNTTLKTGGRPIQVGPYFSNRLLGNNVGELEYLDSFLKEKINQVSQEIDPKVLSLLNRLSFTDGYKNRIYYKSNPGRMKIVSQCWRGKV